jgi:hypothetical protein
VFEGSLGIVLAVLSLSGACLGLSQAVLEATRRFWTTVSRFQAIFRDPFGSQKAILDESFAFSSHFSDHFGSQNQILDDSFMFSSHFRDHLGTQK